MLSSQLIPESFIKYQQQNLKKEKRKKRIKKNLHGKPPRASESKSCPLSLMPKWWWMEDNQRNPKKQKPRKIKTQKTKDETEGKREVVCLLDASRYRGRV